MSEPTTTAAGGVAGYKLALITLPVVASLIAFWLGLRYVPLRADEPQRDLVDHWPQAFTAAETLAVHARLPAVAGFFLLSGCVFVVCSIPGPWIVAAVFRWLEHRREKDIAELATDVVADVRGAIAGKDGAR